MHRIFGGGGRRGRHRLDVSEQWFGTILGNEETKCIKDLFKIQF
jgi:hypothetical protein